MKNTNKIIIAISLASTLGLPSTLYTMDSHYKELYDYEERDFSPIPDQNQALQPSPAQQSSSCPLPSLSPTAIDYLNTYNSHLNTLRCDSNPANTTLARVTALKQCIASGCYKCLQTLENQRRNTAIRSFNVNKKNKIPTVIDAIDSTSTQAPAQQLLQNAIQFLIYKGKHQNTEKNKQEQARNIIIALQHGANVNALFQIKINSRLRTALAWIMYIDCPTIKKIIIDAGGKVFQSDAPQKNKQSLLPAHPLPIAHPLKITPLFPAQPLPIAQPLKLTPLSPAQPLLMAQPLKLTPLVPTQPLPLAQPLKLTFRPELLLLSNQAKLLK